MMIYVLTEKEYQETCFRIVGILTQIPFLYVQLVLLGFIRQTFLGNVDNLDFHRYVVKLTVWILTYSSWGQITVIQIKYMLA